MKKKIEELLELIWTLREKGKRHRADIIAESRESGTGRALREMERDGLIERDGPHIHLSKAGERAAEELIRRHRLAERLMVDLFQLDDEQAEKMACEFEHILSPEVTESVCTFLGHPPTCPHGKPIPRGECCRTFKREVKPLVVPLTELNVGEQGKITYITTHHHARLDRLTALGIVPGNTVRLHQKRPSFIVQVDETHIAMEPEIAREIYVRRLPK